MTTCIVCQIAATAEAQGTAPDVIRRQAVQIDTLTDRLIDAALALSKAREVLDELEASATIRNRRLAEVTRQLDALRSRSAS